MIPSQPSKMERLFLGHKLPSAPGASAGPSRLGSQGRRCSRCAGWSLAMGLRGGQVNNPSREGTYLTMGSIYSGLWKPAKCPPFSRMKMWGADELDGFSTYH